MSPTQRSLKVLRDAGFLVEIVERWIPFPKPGHRRDLFNFVDLLAVHPETGVTLAVQTTSGSNLSHRRKKLAANPNLASCVAAGWRVVVHGWAKKKVKRGGRAYKYKLIEDVIAPGGGKPLGQIGELIRRQYEGNQ